MKKTFTFLTGIVFFLTILIAGACDSPGNPEDSERSLELRDPKTVTIHLKVVKQNGDKHLKMHNSYKRNHKVVDTLETLVVPGDTVVWVPRRFLGRIKQMEKIGSDTKGDIINMDAEQIPGTRNFRLIIPEAAPVPSEREKYDIIFEDRSGNTWPIDPYLRIPRLQ